MLLDLTHADRKLLGRYMGNEGMKRYFGLDDSLCA